MLDAGLVIIEVISTNPRAPSVKRQQDLIRADGTYPEKRFDSPEHLEDLPFLLKRGESDVVCIAHPKAFGSPNRTRAVLEAVARSDAAIKLPNEDPIRVDTDEQKDAFLLRVAQTAWGAGTRKQLRNPGRPHKLSQPNEQQKATYRRMWFGDRKTFPPRVIKELASAELGRPVEDWELKHWFGASRTPPNSDE